MPIIDIVFLWIGRIFVALVIFILVWDKIAHIYRTLYKTPYCPRCKSRKTKFSSADPAAMQQCGICEVKYFWRKGKSTQKSYTDEANYGIQKSR